MRLPQSLQLMRHVGWPAWAGMVMLLWVAWAHLQWLPSLVRSEQELAQQVRRTRHDLLAQTQAPTQPQSPSQGGATLSVAQSPQAVWQAAWQALPSDAEQHRMLGLVSRTAEQHQLAVPSIQYSGQTEPWSQQADQVLWRQRVSMPVEGRYADVRAWLARLFHQQHISLDSIELQRVDAASDQVRAQVQLSLWWKRSMTSLQQVKP